MATLLSVSPPTVYAALRRSEVGLDHLRTPGGQIRVRRHDVLAYCHRAGIEVPRGLITDATVVVVHPDRRASARLGRTLEGVARTTRFVDPVDALVHVGAAGPAMLLLSHRLGDDLTARAASALEDATWLGYTCVLRLVPGREVPWSGGPVPQPLDVGESSGRALATLVGSLLGTG